MEPLSSFLCSRPEANCALDFQEYSVGLLAHGSFVLFEFGEDGLIVDLYELGLEVAKEGADGFDYVLLEVAVAGLAFVLGNDVLKITAGEQCQNL